LDGKNLWDVIQRAEVSEAISWKNREILLDLDDFLNCTFDACGAVRKGDWKFIRGANMVRNSHSVGFNEWYSDFSTCAEDTLGCSSYSGHFNSLYCAFTKNGCLFNMALDPCEMTNRGDLHPEIRKYFIDRLERYQRETPEPLMLYVDKLNWSSMAPSMHCDDTDFWCPFMEYEVVNFEEKLTADLSRLWPSEEQTEYQSSGSSLLFGPNSMMSVMAVFLMLTLLCIARNTRCGRNCLKMRDEHTPLLISDINPLMF